MSSSNTSSSRKKKTGNKTNQSESFSQTSEESTVTSLSSSSTDMSLTEEDNVKTNFISSLTKEELERYESFRRSTFSQTEIKKLILNSIGQSVNPNFVIVVSSLAKVFSAELIIEACKIQKFYGEENLRIKHIDEAFRRLFKKMPNLRPKRVFTFK